MRKVLPFNIHVFARSAITGLWSLNSDARNAITPSRLILQYLNDELFGRRTYGNRPIVQEFAILKPLLDLMKEVAPNLEPQDLILLTEIQGKARTRADNARNEAETYDEIYDVYDDVAKTIAFKKLSGPFNAAAVTWAMHPRHERLMKRRYEDMMEEYGNKRQRSGGSRKKKTKKRTRKRTRKPRIYRKDESHVI